MGSKRSSIDGVRNSAGGVCTSCRNRNRASEERSFEAAPKRPVAGSFQTGPIIIIMVLVLGSGAMLRRRAITKWSH